MAGASRGVALWLTVRVARIWHGRIAAARGRIALRLDLHTNVNL